MNNTNVMQKWQQTGLLNEATSKESLALALENISENLMLSADSFKEKINPVAAMTIPIVTKALNNKIFSFNQNNISSKESIFVSIPQNSDDEQEMCDLAANALLEKISKYNNLNVHGIFVVPQNDGFTLEVRCS